MSRPSLSKLTALYCRIGNLTFGGGDPTMAALQRELVGRRHWLDPDQYGLVYSLARITPGTNLLAFCAGAAWVTRGWPGAILAVLAVTLPSAALVVWLTYTYGILRTNAHAMGAIGAIIAAAVGMMATGAWQLIHPHLTRTGWVRTVLLLAGSVALSLGFSRTPIEVLALAAIAGFFWRDGRNR
jgi:chromate transporter